ncbi:MAG TPA: hypothetical protein VF407_24140 [Polyangiaceae bacterium]
MSPQELKKALISAGFEVYRTKAEEVMLADRVRDNLILDSGVRVRAKSDAEFEVRLVMGVRKTQYPGDDENAMFDRVRKLAEPVLKMGFDEIKTAQAPVADPSDQSRTLDTFFDVEFGNSAPSFDDAVPLVKAAIEVAKTAESRH